MPCIQSYAQAERGPDETVIFLRDQPIGSQISQIINVILKLEILSSVDVNLKNAIPILITGKITPVVTKECGVQNSILLTL